MKNGIHPESRMVAFVESGAGNVFLAKSTIKTENTYTHEGVEYPSMFIEVSSKTHPHYTGEKRLLKTGAVDKFYARQKKMEELKNAKK
ncbi:50S ribosomal protein L31 [Candidatus Gracilibacteria bacterium]|nr:50S ribosomal protein L31 [Candidatus Gracilibacteria bacterium]